MTSPLTAKNVDAARRRLAEYEATAAAESRSKTIDEHNAAFRWMVASLFALNGGAILALLSSEIASPLLILRAVPAFFIGVICTFATVILGQLSDRRMIAQMHRWGLYWSGVRDTAERDEKHEKEIKREIDAAERLGRRARIFGILSMLSFIVGIIIAGFSLAAHGTAPSETKHALVGKK